MASLTEGETQPGSGDEERDEDDSSVSSVKNDKHPFKVSQHSL